MEVSSLAIGQLGHVLTHDSNVAELLAALTGSQKEVPSAFEALYSVPIQPGGGSYDIAGTAKLIDARQI